MRLHVCVSVKMCIASAVCIIKVEEQATTRPDNLRQCLKQDAQIHKHTHPHQHTGGASASGPACACLQGTHMIMGGVMIVKQGEQGVSYMFTEDFWGDHPTISKVQPLTKTCQTLLDLLLSHVHTS